MRRDPETVVTTLRAVRSVGGQRTEKARVSWLIVGPGFGGRRVFHNDMEQLPDMHARGGGHPLLSLLIPDSSFSLEPQTQPSGETAQEG